MVLTDDVSRQGIIDAFKKRHSYAATDNILLDVRSGDHMMGDAFTTAKRPTLDDPRPRHRPDRQGPRHPRQQVRLHAPSRSEREVKLRYTDMDAKPGKSHYYYVRVEQADGNLAWASPMWITYQP